MDKLKIVDTGENSNKIDCTELLFKLYIPEFTDIEGLDLETIVEKLCNRNCHQVSCTMYLRWAERY